MPHACKVSCRARWLSRQLVRIALPGALPYPCAPPESYQSCPGKQRENMKTHALALESFHLEVQRGFSIQISLAKASHVAMSDLMEAGKCHPVTQREMRK